MKNISRIKDLAKEVNNRDFWDLTYKKAKSFFENEENKESLHFLISSENNLEYLNLAKVLNIKVPTKIILKSLEHKNNLNSSNYSVLFRMHEKELLKNIDIIKEYFDTKIVKNIESSKINNFFRKDSQILNDQIYTFYKAREDELRNIYESITLNDFLDTKIHRPQDFNVNFSWNELDCNSFYRTNDIIILFNLDIICQVYIKGEEFDKTNLELRDYIYELESIWRTADSISKRIEDEKNSIKIKVLSIIEKKEDFEGLVFPTQVFSDKIKYVKRHAKLKADLVEKVDKEIGFRMQQFRNVFKKIKQRKINFFGFSKYNPTRLAVRLIATEFDFLERENIFIISENAGPNFLSSFANHYKKIIVFGMHENSVPKSYMFESFSLASAERVIENVLDQ